METCTFQQDAFEVDAFQGCTTIPVPPVTIIGAGSPTRRLRPKPVEPEIETELDKHLIDDEDFMEIFTVIA